MLIKVTQAFRKTAQLYKYGIRPSNILLFKKQYTSQFYLVVNISPVVLLFAPAANFCRSKYENVGVLLIRSSLSVSAVHRPFHISICISTLPTQHTTFISIFVVSLSQQMLAPGYYHMECQTKEDCTKKNPKSFCHMFMCVDCLKENVACTQNGQCCDGTECIYGRCKKGAKKDPGETPERM